MRLVLVPDGDELRLLPVCSCCRMRALRPAGSGGRICPTCDRGDTSVPDMPNRQPPDGTNRGV